MTEYSAEDLVRKGKKWESAGPFRITVEIEQWLMVPLASTICWNCADHNKLGCCSTRGKSGNESTQSLRSVDSLIVRSFT